MEVENGDVVKIEILNATTPAKSKTYAAGAVLQIDVTTALGGATNYVDLFGYLIDLLKSEPLITKLLQE